MDASAIKERRFTEAMRGYKKEEVDEFLSDLADEFDRLSYDNSELEKKLGVLADKIREYREDEDALKDALLGAQKQGNAVIASAKEKSAEMIEEAQNKCDEMIAEAEKNVAEKNAEAEKTIADALAEKQRIEEESKKRAEELHTEMEIQNEIDRDILAKTMREAEDFRTRLIVEYTTHMEMIKNIPEQCENEFVKNATGDYTTERLRSLIEKRNELGVVNTQIPVPASVEAEEASEDDSDIKVVDSFSDIAVSENESETIEEETGAFTVESAFAYDDDTSENNAPDFLNVQPQRSGNKSKYEKLEFGNNTSGNNKNKKRR